MLPTEDTQYFMHNCVAVKYVFGPVPSRRLGRSLGVSPIPAKTCNYSCIYCQLGRTPERSNARERFFPREDILAEIRKAVEAREFDYLTFVGDGEPTLNADLGWLIRKSKEFTKQPIAVITNGALLCDPKVAEELSNADVIMPSLDAPNEKLWKRINRPHRDLMHADVVQGLIDFSSKYSTRIFLEVMLVDKINDSDNTLHELAKIIERIRPAKVFVNVPIRPPAESYAQPPDEKRQNAAELILGNVLAHKEMDEFDTSAYSDEMDALVTLSARHPLRLEQIRLIFSCFGKAFGETEISRLRQLGFIISKHGDSHYFRCSSDKP